MLACETLNRHKFLLQTASSVAILTGVLTASSVYAQAAPPPTANPTDELSEVVVTAEKRTESLLTVAAPVTALQTTELERQEDVKLTDYAASVPGLNLISSEPGQTVVFLRGINSGFGAGISTTTATYIDDAPYGSSTASAYGSIGTLDIDPSLLQRIEVLRGPQGTLYGASALGGLIKYVTIPPSLTHYFGRVEVDGSALDGGGQGGGVRAMFDGPLINHVLGFTISAFDRLEPGYIDDPHRNLNNVNSSRADGGRAALLWQPTDKFSGQLSLLVQNSYTPNTSEVDLNTNMTPIYGKYQQVRYGDEDWDLRNTQYGLNLNYDFGWAALTSISSYAHRTAVWDIDETVKFGGLVSSNLGIPNLGLFDNVTLDSQKETQEIRLTSASSDTFEWLGGLYFTHEHSVKPEAFGEPFSTLTNIPVPYADLPPDAQPSAGGLFTDILHDTFTEYAGYGDLTYHVTSQFKILGGVRVTSDSETGITPYTGRLNGPTYIAVGSSTSHPVTYLVSPSFDLDKNSMIYARVATGFRPGGPTGDAPTNIQGGAPVSYRPDTLTNYEVGSKAQFPEQRMTIDVSAYDIEWKDIQVLTEINGFFDTGNGASARSDGTELAWTWKPVMSLSLAANAAYTDARLTQDAPAIGGKSGDNLPNVPKFTANVSADYDFPITGDASGFAGGNFQYNGARSIDFVSGTPAGYVRPVMPEYSTFDVRAGLMVSGLTVETYIKNVGNTYGITRLVSEVRDGYDGPLGAAVIPPRTFGLSISTKF